MKGSLKMSLSSWLHLEPPDPAHSNTGSPPPQRFVRRPKNLFFLHSPSFDPKRDVFVWRICFGLPLEKWVGVYSNHCCHINFNICISWIQVADPSHSPREFLAPARKPVLPSFSVIWPKRDVFIWRRRLGRTSKTFMAICTLWEVYQECV